MYLTLDLASTQLWLPLGLPPASSPACTAPPSTWVPCQKPQDSPPFCSSNLSARLMLYFEAFPESHHLRGCCVVTIIRIISLLTGPWLPHPTSYPIQWPGGLGSPGSQAMALPSLKPANGFPSLFSGVTSLLLRWVQLYSSRKVFAFAVPSAGKSHPSDVHREHSSPRPDLSSHISFPDYCLSKSPRLVCCTCRHSL